MTSDRQFSISDTPPVPAYEPSSKAASTILRGKPELYDKIASAPRTLVNKFEIQPRSGESWKVPKGYVCRLTTPKGPQVGDLNIWNSNNPRERFWASRTRQLHQSHVSTYDRLWSCLPYLRPLCTIIGDSLQSYGTDRWNGRVHDLLGTRCDPYVDALLSGTQCDFHCHSNLVRSVIPHGLTEFDVHDVLNVFQVTGLDKEGRYFMEASPANDTDYFEFFAEQDLLCALSACPGGDLSKWGWGSEEDMLETCRPLGVEVYKLDNGAPEEWHEPQVAPYVGRHGLKYDSASN